MLHIPPAAKRFRAAFTFHRRAPSPLHSALLRALQRSQALLLKKNLLLKGEKKPKTSQLALSLSHCKQVRNKRQLQEEAAPRHPLSEALFHTQSTLLHRPAAESTRG